MSRRAVALFVAIPFWLVGAWGQGAAKTQLSYKLLSIHVKGLNHFKDDQVIRASGLELGRNATEQDFKQAVAKLGDTGLFTDVAYSYHYSPRGCDLELQVAENNKLVPILFDNFVWFSDDELLAALRQRVPLFEGRLPLQGTLANQVAGALNGLLAERKITGHAEFLESGSLNGPLDSYLFQVKLHPIIVRNVEFPGATVEDLTALRNVSKPLAGQEYLRSTMRPHEKLDFLPVYLARGYLKAQLGDSQARVVEDGPRTVVDISFPVSKGIQYRVTQLQWTGASTFPVQQLQTLVHQKAGDPANAVQLQNDLENVGKLYGTKGYLAAKIDARPTLNDATSSVAYELNVVEGDQFRMGELQIDGIDAYAEKQLRAQWQIKQGDIFDDSYLKKFFQVTYHDFGLSRSFSVVSKQIINRQAKTVDVALHFVPKK